MINKGLLKNIPADQWDNVKIIRESGVITFSNQEDFNSLVSMMGEQEVEYEFINEQRVESKEVVKLEEELQTLSLSSEKKDQTDQAKGEIRNILLMGRTGGGKSTLGNVLVNAEKFGVSHKSVSSTKDTQVEELEISVGGTEKITYRIVDTIGLGDTNLETKDVLWKLGTIAYEIKDGLNQVLFVTRGRLTKEEIEAYDLLRSVIFDSGVDKYATIIKTGFADFEEEDECEKDRQALLNESSELSNLVKRVRKILYVDNPPTDMTGTSKRIKDQIELNKKTREESRKRVLTYLATCRDNYKPVNLDDMSSRIGDYMTDDEKLRKQMEEIEKNREAEAEKFRKELKDIEDKRTKELAEINEKYANDQLMLQAKIQELNNNTELKREERRRSHECSSKLVDIQIKEIEARMERDRQTFAHQMEIEKEGIVQKAWSWAFGRR